MFKETAGNLSTDNETSALDGQFSEDITKLLLIPISLLVIVTVLGNSIIILAFIVDKRLRNQSNLFLFNLSICDFLIGAFTVPMYIPYRFTGKWMFGTLLCKLILIIDYTVLTASTFSVVLISYDRFLSVIKAVLYQSLQKKHSHTFALMTSSWILAFLLYGPAIIAWEDDLSAVTCVARFNDNWHFRLVASCLDFILPLTSVLFFNVAIYCNNQKRSRNTKHNSSLQFYKEKDNDARPSILGTCIILSSPQLQGIKDLGPSTKKKSTSFFLKQWFGKRKISSSTGKDNTIDQISTQINKLSQDKKLAKSISILVFVFFLCCAPYSFLATVIAVCRGYCVDFFWYDITIWMVFMNSAINPFIYAVCHKGYKSGFALLLRKCQRFLKKYK